MGQRELAAYIQRFGLTWKWQHEKGVLQGLGNSLSFLPGRDRVFSQQTLHGGGDLGFQMIVSLPGGFARVAGM